MINRNKVINTVISERAEFVEQYMKEEAGQENED
jgi:hypothetical protein